ncbi:hypothetical protein [Rhizobium etli]|nr:hypothetical protein [Rhizobium etli]
MQTQPPIVEPVRAAIGRDIAREISDFMLVRPGCTRDELREEFSDRQINRYASEAKIIADKRSVRRVA